MATPFESPSTGPVDDGLDRLLTAVGNSRPDADLEVIRRAGETAIKAHEGQTRKSGEAYILHPFEVAEIVAELGMDQDSIVAAVLHDVLEDTQLGPEQIAQQFGTTVLELVEGVTKLQLNINPDANARQRRVAETDRAAETLRKMLLAMAKDFRVIVIKLADRLHNMRTLGALPPEKQTRIANETLDIYAPLAARLGIWQIKWQLEDLAFKILHPDEFYRISELVAATRAEREQQLDESMRSLRDHLDERGLTGAKINGRPKHLFSIYNKMVQQGIPFEEIYDIIALRVIVEETYQCYLALGVVHELWLPMPGLFYDYIASPKPNGYQSLHTKVLGPGKAPLEIQIRTMHMHEVAEYGVAAHWGYKEGKAAQEDDRFGNLRRQLFDWSSDNQTSSDFLRSVSTDLFSEQVFAFTPKGDVIALPRGSTPIDFAFRVHSSLGLTLIGAKINGNMLPLSTEIKNGDVVELVSRSNAQPSLDWLEHAKSPQTRTKLRAYFRRKNKDASANRGKEAVEKELRSQGMDPRLYLGEDKMAEVVKHVANCENASDVFARVGAGLTSVQAVVDRLKTTVKEPQEHPIFKARPSAVEPTVITSGIDNVELKRAKCCQPLPGEEVVGFVSRGRGIVLHRKLCPNISKLEEAEADRVIPIRWPSDGTYYPIDIKVICGDRQGLLMDISTIFGESKTNVSAAKIQTLANHTAEIDVTLDVRDTQHLRDLMAKISNYNDVISILRVMGRGGK